MAERPKESEMDRELELTESFWVPLAPKRPWIEVDPISFLLPQATAPSPPSDSAEDQVAES